MSLFKALPKLNRFLTLYMQRRWYTDPWVNQISNGRVLLPSLLPALEAGGFDSETDTPAANVSSTTYYYFMAPELFTDRVRLRGTGFACLDIGTNTNVAGGRITLNWLTLALVREATPYVWPASGVAQRYSPAWANTTTVETRRSYHLDMKTLDFLLNPDQHLILEVGINITTVAQAGTRVLHYRRNVPESYLMLPVREE